MSQGTIRDLAALIRQRSTNAMNTIIGHHWNQKAAINRAAEAKAWGILPLDWMLPAKDWPTPFSQQIVTIDDHSSGRSFGWLRWLLVPTALAGIGGGGYLFWPEIKPQPQPHHTERVLKGDADVKAGEITIRHKDR